jgi:tetratricopeptide (TPR) repeat protein
VAVAGPSVLARVGLAAAVFALAAAVYWPVRGHAWLNYDDDIYVTRPPEIRLGTSWEGVRWAFGSQQGANWFPLTRLSWLHDYQHHGLEAGGFLSTNLWLHALASALLFLALAQLTGALGRSAFVAAVFAVHPLHVESVAWVSARKDLLAGVCFGLALLCHAWFARSERSRVALAALCASLALGLLAKPVLVTLPFVLLLLDAWPLARLTRPGGGFDEGRVTRALFEKLPLFALSILSCWATLAAQQAAGVVVALERVPLVDRVANALVAYAVYLRRFFWPGDLAVFYPHPAGGVSLALALAAGALLLALTVLALRAWPRRGYLAVGWLWFLGMLVPMIGLVQVGSQALADRYTYLPLSGLALALAWGAVDFAGPQPGRRTALAAAALVAVAALSVATRAQLAHWRDSVALFEHALAVTRENHIAHAQLGAAYGELGRTADSARHWREAVRIRPDFRTALNNLAWLLATARDPSLREPDLAVTLAERAVRLTPVPEAAVLDTLAAAYAADGRFDDAVATAERALVWTEAEGELALAEGIRKRLGLYRAGRAWSE